MTDLFCSVLTNVGGLGGRTNLFFTQQEEDYASNYSLTNISSIILNWDIQLGIIH